MEQLTIGEIAVFVAFIVALLKGIEYLAEKYKKPTNDLEQKVDKKLEGMQSDINFILKAVTQLVEHESNGNNVEELRKLHAEMRSYIISTRRG